LIIEFDIIRFETFKCILNLISSEIILLKVNSFYIGR